MAKTPITIKLSLEYDPEENKGIPPRIFLYQLINRLSYNHAITEIEYLGKKIEIKDLKDVKDLPLKKIDSIDKADLPIVEKRDVTPAPEYTSEKNLLIKK